MLDRDADLDRVGESEAGKEAAAAFRDESDDGLDAGSSSPASIRIAFTAASKNA